MKKISILMVCAAFVILTLGCQGTQTRAVKGGLIGGVIGAAAGGIIGHQSGHGNEGAAIGAAAGVFTGAIAGSQINKPGQAAQGAIANPSQMSVQEIALLAKQGVHESVIIDRIYLTNSKFNLTAEDVSYLKQEGVSQKVIEVMQAK